MISIIIPFYNEKDNLPALINPPAGEAGQLVHQCNKLKQEYEIILVNDGSTDGSISMFDLRNSRIKIIHHKKKLGKGQALFSGLQEANGDVIIFMDADLQDDPEDLPKFVKKIEAGYDFVNGIRIGRKDNTIIKIYSTLARYFLQIFLHSPFSDINCGFKAFRREVLSDFTFYGNNFRFFPLAVYYNGYRVTEIPVKNNPRLHGKSKYGIEKVFVGLLDTLTAYFIYKFSERPLHFFGIVGGALFVAGFLVSLYLTIERLFFGVLLYRRPALLLGVVLLIVGIQIITTGIIGELIVYLNKKKK
ncbi:glycosyltransferase family 2 protein [Candidatus Roizmanbacteria bacterium]|nr:glycosyltransferase family 2 protein [Candidatus Roizmanbacteria bacterium]